MASTYLSKTFASSGNRQRQTISVWVKRSALGATSYIFSVYYNSTYWAGLYFNSSDQLKYYVNNGGYDLTTNRKFRDTNAWYHIVIELNTTEATASDRIKMYVNGVQETSFASTTYPSLNAEVTFGDNYSHYIGTYNAGTDNFDGSMSHFHFITNTAYDASAFGQFDSNGVWTIKTEPSVTYGTNGFFILKDGNSVTDQSGNSNNFTVAGGTLTNTEDNPSNVFATLNPLDAYYDVCTLSNGNTTYDGNSAVGNYTFTPATMGFNKGKWYWEMKFGSSDSDNWGGIGITSASSTGTQNYLGGSANAYAYYGRTLSGGLGVTYTNNTQTNQGLPFTNNDIIMVAVDCDNLAIYFGKNGTWLNNSSSVTGVPTSGASKTGAFFSITDPTSTTAGFYFPASGTYSGSQVYPQNLNFGNGYFGTTPVSSAGTNESGIGIFEYDVPNGYTALSTKGLNL